MKFEHLIEINNPDNPHIEMMTRAQLWKGLVLRVEMPRLFLPQLDSCDILERTPNSISRCLRYGKLIVNDRVTLLDGHQVRVYIPAQDDIVESSLEMTIEEPQPGYLFVRFLYQDTTPEDGPEAPYNNYRRSAYYESDLDTIRIIRKLSTD